MIWCDGTILTRSFILHDCGRQLTPSILSLCLFFMKHNGNCQSISSPSSSSRTSSKSCSSSDIFQALSPVFQSGMLTIKRNEKRQKVNVHTILNRTRKERCKLLTCPKVTMRSKAITETIKLGTYFRLY